MCPKNYASFVDFKENTLTDEKLILNVDELLWLLNELNVAFVDGVLNLKQTQWPSAGGSEGLDRTAMMNNRIHLVIDYEPRVVSLELLYKCSLNLAKLRILM